MASSVAELRAVAERLEACAESAQPHEIGTTLVALEEAATAVGKAWSGSWLGYQSRVYYQKFMPSPPGKHFSTKWGFYTSLGRRSEGWEEFDFEDVKAEIFRRAKNPDLQPAREAADKGRRAFEESRDEIISILEVELPRRKDPFLERLLEDAKKAHLLTAAEYIESLGPGPPWSRDSLAVSQGLQAPPHVTVLAEVATLRSPAENCAALARIAGKAAAHLERPDRQQQRASRVGTNVFIGHGRSLVWKDLKDFVKERLRLPYDEFNRVPIAGVANVARLAEMLDAAAIALLVMTAEDEQADGKMHARMNVVHEAGLFQGRLGFTRAIILLEEGCEEFSNVEGLGQIRFPKGNITAAFEEIRRVLEREGVLEP